ncbi:MAG: hypothetical protein D6682_00305 [Zetaproteobacteria bacterium]|nr:MAG: hypothetical protein D6682_00305 [Zetaproteobacteria bacterium]
MFPDEELHFLRRSSQLLRFFSPLRPQGAQKQGAQEGLPPLPLLLFLLPFLSLLPLAQASFCATTSAPSTAGGV